MKTHRQKLTRLAILAGIISTGGLYADTVIKDQFGLKERGAGLTLNGNPTESGDATWETTRTVELAGEGDAGYVVVADNKPFMGRVAVPPNAKVISVEAKVRAVSDQGNNWIAVGIGNPKLGTPGWGKGVFLFVDAAGSYFSCCGASDPAYSPDSFVRVGGGPGKVPPGFNPDGMNLFKLQYNVSDNSVSAWINGVQVMENTSLEGKGFTVEPAFAGFSGFWQKQGAKTVSDFTVTCAP